MTPYPPEIELEDIPCPLGCNSQDEKVLVGRDWLHQLPGEYFVVKCRSCGLLRTNPRPTVDTIGYYYPEDYGPYLGTVIHAPDGDALRLPAWKKLLLPLFRWNTERLPDLPPGRLLEIGCASGQFLHGMAQRGWVVKGVEPSAKAAENARRAGHDVFQGSFEAMPVDEPSYDLIVGWMVLEHLHDPVRALQKMHRLAKSGGYLVISMPNAGSLEFRVFRQHWYALQVPNHLFHYTPRTLKRVLERGGWRMERIFHQRVLSNIAASTGHVLKELVRLPRVADVFLDFPNMAGISHYLAYPPAFLLSLFGQTGRMTVWARRFDD
jgi:SAM-dependent methyltransferase